MSDRIPITPSGLKMMQEDLKQLRGPDLQAACVAVETARAHGDLSENAEYDAAKEHHAKIIKQIGDLEGMINRAQVIDPAEVDYDRIKFGATVQLLDTDSDDEVQYQIVGTYEADIKQGRISIESPIARGLIGKEEGDEVTIKTPGGAREFEILGIE